MNYTIDDILNRWTNAEEIRLHAGEIDPDNMRTILAITRALAREIREIMEENAVGEVELNVLRGALGSADAELHQLRKIVKGNDDNV